LALPMSVRAEVLSLEQLIRLSRLMLFPSSDITHK
jgi:hypothetical protein